MNGNLPLGAEYDPRAPYNQPDNEDIELPLNVTAKLCADVTVWTSDAFYVCDEDEDGRSCVLETCNVDVESEFTSQHYTPEELLKELKKVCEVALSSEKEPSKRTHLKNLIDECGLWVDDGLDVELT